MCLAALAAPGCRELAKGPAVPAEACHGEVTAITDVQGPGEVSPLVNSTVVLRGVVTRVEPGTGLYIEDAGPTGGSRSRGLFVRGDALSRSARPGQQVEISGRVAELGDEPDPVTALIDVADHSVCAENVALPLTTAQLPLDRQAREAFEGMRLALDQPLVITDVYNMHRGEWAVSLPDPLRMPTEDVDPGRDARELRQRNRQRELRVALPGPGFPALPVGSAVGPLTGVLGHDGSSQRLYAEARPAADAARPQPLEPPAEGHLRIVGLNLLNFFNGDGRGGGFPTERGARTPEEFRAQQSRTQAALARLQPHLLAVQELENDGFGAASAAQSLLDLLNETGADDWDVVDPGVGPIGGDVITVGLFYRRNSLETVGPVAMLEAPAFKGRSRVPLAQVFRDRQSGEPLLVAVNHLKSKGRCPEDGPDSDQGDGQGCWNRARVTAVETLTPWLAGLAQDAGTPNILVLGDMNAWRREEPIRAFRDAGYLELVEEVSGLPQHSFLYFGARGTLDYAFATPALRPSVRRASIWHINADWPRRMPQPEPWLRMSDHDPVVVDFEFSQSATAD